MRKDRWLTATAVATLFLVLTAGCAQQPARRGGEPVAPTPGATDTRTAADPTAATDPTQEIRTALPGAEVIILGNTALVAMTGTTTATGTTDTTGTATPPGTTGTPSTPGTAMAPDVTTPGATAGAGAGGVNDARATVSRVAPYLTEMRFTSDSDKVSRLTTIAGNIRTGRSAVDFLTELADVSRGMTVIPLGTRTDGPAAGPDTTPVPGIAPLTPGATAPVPATPTAPGTIGTAPANP